MSDKTVGAKGPFAKVTLRMEYVDHDGGVHTEEFGLEPGTVRLQQSRAVRPRCDADMLTATHFEVGPWDLIVTGTQALPEA